MTAFTKNDFGFVTESGSIEKINRQQAAALRLRLSIVFVTGQRRDNFRGRAASQTRVHRHWLTDRTLDLFNRLTQRPFHLVDRQFVVANGGRWSAACPRHRIGCQSRLKGLLYRVV